jgi:hypothetical protein
VIEGGQIGPGNSVVALRAIGDWEDLRIAGMCWIIGLVISGQVASAVAAVTIRDVCQIEVVIDVTGCAGRGGVRAVENKTGAAMVKRRTCPACRAMTRTALRDGEALLSVNWVIGLLIRG